eukprot:TRINITY_DN12307_c0_g2_i4.p1 TRINITY_DN12307_c0_g2~~TRINITY_DN12307_c0_g2_i4.p1  ORF type:complete len:123 (-),score=13.07 TRINITY_DN12307_c0_g2_i4:91-459(-)
MTQKKIERSRRTTMFLKIEATKEEAKHEINLEQMMKTYEWTTAVNQKLITDSLQQQEHRFAELFERRRGTANPSLSHHISGSHNISGLHTPESNSFIEGNPNGAKSKRGSTILQSGIQQTND